MIKEKIFLFLAIILVALIIFNYSLYFPFKNKKDSALRDNAVKKYPLYIKGIYINSWTAGNPRKMSHFINLIKKTELNGVIIDIKEVGGEIAFQTKNKNLKRIGTEKNIIKNPKKLISNLHKNNIYAIARIAVFKDNSLPKIMPELALKTKNNKLWRDYSGKTWLDPASKRVWDYHLKIAEEAIKIGFDEINFDYVRFPSDGNISNIIYPFWNKKTPKSEVIRNFFEYLTKKLRYFNVYLSVDLFGLTMVRKDDMNIGQILENAAPYFDFVCPMVYPSHYPPGFNNYSNPAEHPYEIIYGNLIQGQDRINKIVGQKSLLRPWLQDFDLGANYNEKMIKLEKEAVYNADAYGWLLWNPANRYTEKSLELSN